MGPVPQRRCDNNFCPTRARDRKRFRRTRSLYQEDIRPRGRKTKANMHDEIGSSNKSNNAEDESKRLLGQFFTTTNPFANDRFLRWVKGVPKFSRKTVLLEPFAGSNNIVQMIREFPELKKNEWMCFDIQPVEPKANATFDGDGVFVPITSRDTIADMPEGYVVGITNPP